MFVMAQQNNKNLDKVFSGFQLGKLIDSMRCIKEDVHKSFKVTCYR